MRARRANGAEFDLAEANPTGCLGECARCAIDGGGRDGARLVSRSPRGLEGHGACGQVPAFPLGIHSGDEVPSVQHRHREVAVLALGCGNVRLEAVLETEHPLSSGAMPHQRVEG